MGAPMFEVTKYDPPFILVTCRRTGETYKFLVRPNGDVSHDEASLDQGRARRTAIAYLVQTSRAATGTLATAAALYPGGPRPTHTTGMVRRE